jgi:two-component system, OmpR family, KDP operon response regulator KdpE
MTGSPIVPTSFRLLVVDDEAQIIEVLQTFLTNRGYEVRSADDGETALEVFRNWKPELVITDLSMPRMGGIALCRAIRSHSEVPIIVLSVREQETIKVEALESGADDYVTKPFGMHELLARIRAALRRSHAPNITTQRLKIGVFVLDFAAHRAEVRGKEVYLTPKEFELLTFFLQNAGRVLTHKKLLSAIWGRTYSDQPDAVRVLVRQLRRKIELNPATPTYLKTEPWIGYRFEAGE